MSSVVLTAAMRANLASLQGTAQLLGQTQERLATGNKVNSALDNPSSFFAAQGLNNRASGLSALIDSMGQSVQALTAASKGIDGLTALLNQAKSTAQTALAQATDGASASSQFSFTAAQQLNIVGVNANGTIAAGTFTVQHFDATGAAAVGPLSTITIGASETMAALLTDLNSISGVSATLAVDIATPGSNFLQIRTTDGSALKISNVTAGEVAALFGTGVTSGTAFLPTNTAPVDRTSLEAAFSAIAGSTGQISQLVKDTGYGGKNLLGGETLKVQFNETNTTSITGTKRDAAGLGLTAANIGTFDTTGHIQASIDAITAALNTLRADGTSYGNGLAVIQARQDFTSALTATLKDGATQLTIADKNEEGANLLALQTQQQLGIQALALASQANQSVLRLFA